MNERFSKQTEPNSEKLKLRLIKAAEPLKRERRSLSISKSSLIQSSNNLANTSSEEMFVMLVEEMKRYKTLISRKAADHALAGIQQLADGLADTLPGNDSGVKFVVESMNYIEGNNPKLSTEITWQIDAATKRSHEREVKREEFYRKWRKNQTS
ncbi:MAG TPA: hypothetical protein PKA38_00495 [Candidatus Levybacteria bacterium]|nr:hypothetical protein [Candidatus Levybacteria bacterium]